MARDSAKSVELLERAAEAGSMKAVFRLGLSYQNGDGVARDYTKARDHYERALASADGDVDRQMAAASNLGVMYERGLGVFRDYAMAHALYERAAEGGNAEALHNLRRLREHGHLPSP